METYPFCAATRCTPIRFFGWVRRANKLLKRLTVVDRWSLAYPRTLNHFNGQ